PRKLKDGLDRYLRPLSVKPTLETDGRANFALCFTHSGRHQILPSEGGSSFLHFSGGEICAYLLHWFLLRIFACDSPLNEDFVGTFSRWRAALGEEGDAHVGLFEELLRTAVILPIDRNVFTDEALSLDREVREK